MTPTEIRAILSAAKLEHRRFAKLFGRSPQHLSAQLTGGRPIGRQLESEARLIRALHEEGTLDRVLDRLGV